MAGKTTSTPKAKAKPRRVAVKAKPVVAESSQPEPTVKRGKPVFQAGTWLTVLLFAALIGFAVYLNSEKEKTAAETVTPASEVVYIFAGDGVVSSIEVNPTDGEAVKVARNAENAWTVETPIEAEANQGLAEAAAAQVSALQDLGQISGDPEIFGLKNPAFTITIGFEGGKERILEIGDATPTNSGYYVRVDKEKMTITDLSGIDSLLQLGFFPPYLNTPTPTSLPPTLTPVPTPEASFTPVP